MKIENIARLLRWDLTNNAKAYRLGAAATFGATIFVYVIELINFYMGGGTPQFTATQFLSIFFLLFCYANICSISSVFRTKKHTISYLMIPASMQEKLCSRIIILYILQPLVIFLSIGVADILHYLTGLLLDIQGVKVSFYQEIGETFYDLGKSIFSTNTIEINFGKEMVINGYFLNFNLTLLCFTFPFMCGCLFTRRAALKAWVTGIVGLTVFAMISSVCYYYLLRHLPFESFVGLLGILAYLFEAVVLLLNVMFVYVGYRVFTHRTILRHSGFF